MVDNKFTTIRVSADTFSKLFILKHNLELKDNKSYSYDVIIKYLFDMVKK